MMESLRTRPKLNRVSPDLDLEVPPGLSARADEVIE